MENFICPFHLKKFYENLNPAQKKAYVSNIKDVASILSNAHPSSSICSSETGRLRISSFRKIPIKTKDLQYERNMIEKYIKLVDDEFLLKSS